MSLQLAVLTGAMSSHLVPIVSLLADGIMIVSALICSGMIEHEEIVGHSPAASQRRQLRGSCRQQLAIFSLFAGEDV